MKTIKIKANYGEKFIKDFIPKILVAKLYKESSDKIYSSMFDYLTENYQINKNDVFNCIQKNLLFSTYNKLIIIRFNDNVYIKKNKLDTLLRFINDGDLNIKGTKLIDNTISWINKNIKHLYLLFLKYGK